MGSFATTRSGQAGSLIFVKCGLDSIRAVFGQSLTPHLLFGFSGGFVSICRIVYGQFCSFSGSFGAVFRQKNDRGIAHSVIVNC